MQSILAAGANIRSKQTVDSCTESLRIERRPDFCVIVEVDIDVASGPFRPRPWMRSLSIRYLFSTRPCDNPARPHFDGLRLIAARVQLLAAVPAAVNKIRSDVHQQGPFNRICDDKPDSVLAQEGDEVGAFAAYMPNLDSMPVRQIRLFLQP